MTSLPADPGQLSVEQRWRNHTRGIAIPTLVLAVLVVVGEVMLWWATLSDRLPLGWGAMLATGIAYVSFTPLHEAAHGNVRGKSRRARWLDPVVGWITAIPLLAPFPAFRLLHLAHHSHTNDADRDPDHWVAGRSAVDVALRCATIAFHYYAYLLAGPISRTRSGARARRTSVVGMAVLGGAMIALTASGHALELVVLWVGPGLVASAALAFLFDWLPHRPHDSQSRFHHTRVLALPWLTVPMAGQNYHLIHHLYPRVPFYRYSACYCDTRELLIRESADIVSPSKGCHGAL